MAELFNRHCAVTIGQPGSLGLQFVRTQGQGHHIWLDIKKNATATADKGVIKIYNLSDVSRARIEKVEKQAIIVDAGYVDEHGVIFQAKVDEAWTERDGAQLVTIIKATDFSEELSRRVVAVDVKDNTSQRAIIQKIADAMGLKIGNISLKDLKDPKQKSVPLYDGGRKLLNEVCGAAGAYWHITDGKLYAANLGLASRQEVIRLASESGLIDSPERGTAGIKGKSLMRNKIQPGVLLQVAKGQNAADDVVVTTCNYKGGTFGQEWYTHFTSLYRKEVLGS